jgi:hypothetical protein
MAYSYDPALADALSRARSTLGDITAPGYLPDETYSAIQLQHTTTGTDSDGNPTATLDEAAATREIATRLAAWAGTQPSSLSDGGSSIAWADRIDQWNRIASGKAGGARAGVARGVRIRRGPQIDYTTGQGDA